MYIVFSKICVSKTHTISCSCTFWYTYAPVICKIILCPFEYYTRARPVGVGRPSLLQVGRAIFGQGDDISTTA